MNPPAPDFTEFETSQVAKILTERYHRPVEMQLADSELRLDPDSSEMTLCPTLYWSELGAQFVVCKTGDGLYRCQFFYSQAEQFGTGRNEYRELNECVMTLLQVQSDHARKSAGLFSGATAENIANIDDTNAPIESDETKGGDETDDAYHGPALL